MVVQDDRSVVRPIGLGIRGDGRSEITSGLDDHTQVIVSDTRALRPGQRVQPRPSPADAKEER
jgi:hypothetical protein